MEHGKVESAFRPFRALLRIRHGEKPRPNLTIVVGVIPLADSPISRPLTSSLIYPLNDADFVRANLQSKNPGIVKPALSAASLRPKPEPRVHSGEAMLWSPTDSTLNHSLRHSQKRLTHSNRVRVDSIKLLVPRIFRRPDPFSRVAYHAWYSFRRDRWEAHTAQNAPSS